MTPYREPAGGAVLPPCRRRWVGSPGFLLSLYGIFLTSILTVVACLVNNHQLTSFATLVAGLTTLAFYVVVFIAAREDYKAVSVLALAVPVFLGGSYPPPSVQDLMAPEPTPLYHPVARQRYYGRGDWIRMRPDLRCRVREATHLIRKHQLPFSQYTMVCDSL